MSKKALVDLIVKKEDTNRQFADWAVTVVQDAITEKLLAGETVTLVGFGRFEPVLMGERTCRNPNTGDTMTVPPRKQLKFKASQVLRDKL